MQIEELKNLISTAAEMRKRMYTSHDQLKANRTLHNFEQFTQTVDAFNKTLKSLPYYMRSFPCRKMN